jgi:hypothetical protein
MPPATTLHGLISGMVFNSLLTIVTSCGATTTTKSSINAQREKLNNVCNKTGLSDKDAKTLLNGVPIRLPLPAAGKIAVITDITLLDILKKAAASPAAYYFKI